MNSTSDQYRMNPAEDTLVYGDELEEGMWVLAESIGMRRPLGESEDDLIRAQRFRRVSGLRRKPADPAHDIPELVHFTGTWIDGYQMAHSSNLGQTWIVKKDPAPEVTAVISEGDLTRHAETIREALKLAQDTAPSAAAALRFAEALAAMEGKG